MEKILGVHTLAISKRFIIEGIDIDFDNGKISQFERVKFQGSGKGVLIVPLERGGKSDLSDTFVYMIEHFMVGIERHGLVLPGGHWEDGMTLEQAVNQELQEEIGLLAHHITSLIEITSPGYMSGTTTFCLAEGFLSSPVQGDEYENIIVHKLSYAETLRMITDGMITDVRTIAALLYVKAFVIL